MNYKILRNSFRTVNSTKSPWALQARGLLNSAYIIFEKSIKALEFINNNESPKEVVLPGSEYDKIVNDSTSINHALFLIGFAIENLLKGLWIEQNNVTEKSLTPDKLPKEIKTHDLKDLVNKLNLNFSKLENDVLDTLTELIKWKGRYPIPLHVTDYTNSDSITFANLLNDFSKNKMPKVIVSIIKKLDDLYSK